MDESRRLDEIELELLESLLQEATPGPWRFEEDDASGKWCIVGPDDQHLFEEPAAQEADEYGGFTGVQADYRLAAEARSALPRLVGEVRRLRGLVRRARELHAELAAAAEEPAGLDENEFPDLSEE